MKFLLKLFMNKKKNNDKILSTPENLEFRNDENYNLSIETLVNSQNYYSATNFLIYVDKNNFKVNIFKGKKKVGLFKKAFYVL